MTSGVPQHLIFFSDCEVESLLLFCSLQLFAGSLKSLHLMGTYASGYFKCNPSACLAFSNLVQQISYVTGTLLRSCGCPAGVQGFVLHKPTAPKGCSRTPGAGSRPLHKRARLTALGSWMHHFLATWLWKRFLAAEGSAFLIWEMG